MTARILPRPQHLGTAGRAFPLRAATITVSGADAATLAAADDLAFRAYGVHLSADAGAALVTVVETTVDAPEAIGTDPRPQHRAGSSEAYRATVGENGVHLAAGSAEAVFRGLLSLAASVEDGVLRAADLTDYPRFAWRGLSLDVVRHWFPAAEVRQLIDLLALHKLNVLHLHLTDTQAWRFEVPGRPGLAAADGAYTAAELDAIVAYAAARHITVVPEFDAPGHVAPTVGTDIGVTVRDGGHAFLRYLDHGDDGVQAFVRDVFAEIAARFDSPYLHIGGDEAFGDPAESYNAFVAAAAAEVRGLGRRVIGWQETIRAGALQSTDLVQLWIAERDRFDPEKAKADLPEEYHGFIAMAAPVFAESVHDPERIAAAGVPVIVSASDPLYLDRRPSDPSTDPAQHETLTTVGFRAYEPRPTTEVLGWDPLEIDDIRGTGAIAAGVEAALWCETVRDLDDAALLLLPRLGLVAQRAWGSASIDRAAVLAATRAHAAAWTALGFGAFFRSKEIFE